MHGLARGLYLQQELNNILNEVYFIGLRTDIIEHRVNIFMYFGFALVVFGVKIAQ